ncbi:MAG: nitrogenase-associated protein [Candidatus Sedimenticola endophacoides]
MSALVFFEKPGCVGNRAQKKLLRSMGLEFEVRDLLSERWTQERLRPFFGDKPVPEWFNQSAPRVKAGEIAVESLSESDALAMMIEEPILICRPLLDYGSLKQSGFVPGAVLDALNVRLNDDEDLQSCPMVAAEFPVCGDSL